MKNWNEKKEAELDQFLERHNPEPKAAPVGELTRIKARLESPGRRRPGWLVS